MTAFPRLRTLSRVVAVAALTTSATPLLAHSPRYDADPATEREPPEGYLPRLSAAAGELCVKQCPNDRSPCDPPAFKTADGRCTTQWK